jgi:hypothetical protein
VPWRIHIPEHAVPTEHAGAQQLSKTSSYEIIRKEYKTIIQGNDYKNSDTPPNFLDEHQTPLT